MIVSVNVRPRPAVPVVIASALRTLVLLACVEICAVHSLDMFAQRTRIRVALCAAWRFTHVWFLCNHQQLLGSKLPSYYYQLQLWRHLVDLALYDILFSNYITYLQSNALIGELIKFIKVKRVYSNYDNALPWCSYSIIYSIPC